MSEDWRKLLNLSSAGKDLVPGDGFRCDRYGLRFPSVWRHVNIITQADLDQHAVAAGVDLRLFKPSAGVFYTLGNEEQFGGIGSLHSEAVETIPMNDADWSLLVRHHATQESAEGYGIAVVDDLNFDETRCDSAVQTVDGWFTLLKIPTKESWLGPCLVYIAERPDGERWRIRVAPDGEEHSD